MRSRRWLVEDVIDSVPGESPVVELACAEDDAQGEALTVFWDYEIDRLILDEEGWADLAARGFDNPCWFAAFLHNVALALLDGNGSRLVPSAVPRRHHAGCLPDGAAPQSAPAPPSQPLHRRRHGAWQDDSRPGLIARELLLRRKAKTIVVAAPPSVLEQRSPGRI